MNVAYNGPLFFRGDLQIEGAPADVDGLRYRAALCRCGSSKNKPFCDNSHIDAGFSDYGAVGETGDANRQKGGPLSVNPIKNGPLMVQGNLSIVASGGRVAWPALEPRYAVAALRRTSLFATVRTRRLVSRARALSGS